LARGLPLVAVLWPGKLEVEVDCEATRLGGLDDGDVVEGTSHVFAMRHDNGDREHFAPLDAELAALETRVCVATANAAPAVQVVAASRRATSIG
jgi:hypothetical protein